MSDLVSIITPCYNSKNYILETIQSVINQSYTNWEWLIIDDHSTDESVRLIDSIVDTRIKLVKLNQNSGAAVARNIGIDMAKGRYLTFLDSDDLWLPNFLHTVVNYLIINNTELVYTAYKRVDENLNPLLEDFVGPDNVDFKRLLLNCPMPMLTTIYDTKRIGKIMIPIVDKREDYAMWLEVLSKIPKARCIPEALAIYRIRDNSYSRNKFIMATKQFSVYYNYLKLPLYQSTYYTIQWALNGLRKYGGI